MPRLFIAVPIPPELIRKISSVSGYFQSQVPQDSLKWVDPKDLHLTVKFLGETPEEKIEQIKTILQQSVKPLASFELSVEKLGMYPHDRQPRTIWLGIQGSGPLITYHKQLDEALNKAGFEKDKNPLSPHLTLARVRQRTDRETAHRIGKILSQFKVDSLGTLKVESINLIQSKLTPQGPIYTTLFSALLSEV